MLLSTLLLSTKHRFVAMSDRPHKLHEKNKIALDTRPQKPNRIQLKRNETQIARTAALRKLKHHGPKLTHDCPARLQDHVRQPQDGLKKAQIESIGRAITHLHISTHLHSMESHTCTLARPCTAWNHTPAREHALAQNGLTHLQTSTHLHNMESQTCTRTCTAWNHTPAN